MKKSIKVSLIVFAIVGICISSFFVYARNHAKVIQSSGLLAQYSKSSLVNDSDVIIRGKMSKIMSSKWSNPNGTKGKRNIITTDTIVDIKELYKGTPYNNKQVTVRLAKGRVGLTFSESETEGDLETSDDMILFLKKDDDTITSTNEDYYVLTGRIQGLFKPNKDKAFDADFVNNSIIGIKLSNFKKEIKDMIDDRKMNSSGYLTPEQIRKINEKEIFSHDQTFSTGGKKFISPDNNKEKIEIK